MTKLNSQGASGTNANNVLKLASIPDMQLDELKTHIPNIIRWVLSREKMKEVESLRNRLISIGSNGVNNDLIKILTEGKVFTTIHKKICRTLEEPKGSSKNQNFEIDFTSQLKVGKKPKAEVKVKPKAEPNPVHNGPAVSLHQYFASKLTVNDLLARLEAISSCEELSELKRTMELSGHEFDEDFQEKLESKEAEMEAAEGKAKRSESANKGVRTKELKKGIRKILTVAYRDSGYSAIEAEVEVRFGKSEKGKDVVEIISVKGGEIKGITEGREYPKRFDSMPAALRDALYPDMAKKHEEKRAKDRSEKLASASRDVLRECASQNAREKQARKEKQVKKEEVGKGKKGKKNQKQNGQKRKAA